MIHGCKNTNDLDRSSDTRSQSGATSRIINETRHDERRRVIRHFPTAKIFPQKGIDRSYRSNGVGLLTFKLAQFMKTKKITSATVSSTMDAASLKFWKLNKKHIYIVKKEFFYNGESWIKTDLGQFPSIFFDLK